MISTHAKSTQRIKKCAPCVHLRLHLAFRVYGLGEKNVLDEDMVNVGVHRQSRSPPTTQLRCWVNVGVRRQSRSPPNIAKLSLSYVDLVWEFAGKAAAPATL